jgi:hypothetical protein
MKIGGNLPPIPSPGGEGKKAASFPDVTVTPTPGGPVPIPYPNSGDTFERAGRDPLASLVGKAELKVWGDPHVRAAQQHASDAGRLLAGGDVAGGLAAWTDAVQHDPGVTIAELLPYALNGMVADVAGTQSRLVSRLRGDGGGIAAELLANAQKMGDGSVMPAGSASAGDGSVRPLGTAAQAGGGGAIDPNALVQHVLRESYQQSTEDLKLYAEKVRGFNDAKQAFREALEGLREGDAGKLAGVGDDAQLANVDLQNVLQKQQQTLQMMSNISKMLHDTAQAVIRKMGG